MKEKYKIINNLSVSESLLNFVNNELLTRTKIKKENFWKGFDKYVHELAHKNKELLEIREKLQKKIDDWHKDRRGEKFDVKNDPDKVEIDFVESRVSDHSAIEAIFNLVNKYEVAGKSVQLKHLSEDCKILLYKASPKFHGVIVEAIDDPRYHLAANPEVFTKGLSEYNL